MNMFDIMLAKKLAGGGSGPAPTLIEKNIDANGDYLASADNADGFSKVSVNVQPNLITKNITNNGTYQASSDSADGYSSVVVNVQGSHDVSGDLVIESGVANDLNITVVIPEGVTEINSGLFQNQKIKSFQLPSTLTTIRGSAFYQTLITSIELRPSITAVESAAFMYCRSLKNVSINGSALGSSMFQGCTELESIDLSSSPTTRVPSQCVNSCTKLESVILPIGCNRIDNSVFTACTSLKSITIPSTVTYIDTGAFTNSGLESIVIPDSVKTLRPSIFQNCKSLASVDVGSSLYGFEGRTFSGCTALMSITLRNTSGVMNYSTDDFANVPANCDIYVPADLVDAYKASAQWSARADYIHAISA